jgi:phage repressor protein C with HTH and peptisase S24 domain
MWPVLEPGGVVIAVPKLQYRHEDVVIIRHNGSEKIKRIWTVQGGRYDVRGDNPSKSTDSRQFGLIKKETILGKVIWPRV